MKRPAAYKAPLASRASGRCRSRALATGLFQDGCFQPPGDVGKAKPKEAEITLKDIHGVLKEIAQTSQLGTVRLSAMELRDCQDKGNPPDVLWHITSWVQGDTSTLSEVHKKAAAVMLKKNPLMLSYCPQYEQQDERRIEFACVVCFYQLDDLDLEEIQSQPSYKQVGMMNVLVPSFQLEIKDQFEDAEWEKVFSKLKPPAALDAMLKIVLPIDKTWKPYLRGKNESLGENIVAKKLGGSSKDKSFHDLFKDVPELFKIRFNDYKFVKGVVDTLATPLDDDANRLLFTSYIVCQYDANLKYWYDRE
jgi:hypothetical protein